MPDPLHWTCPDCGEEIEEWHSSEGFAERIQDHERKHVEREIVVELAPDVLERLRVAISRQRDDEDADMLSALADRLAEGFAGREP